MCVCVRARALIRNGKAMKHVRRIVHHWALSLHVVAFIRCMMYDICGAVCSEWPRIFLPHIANDPFCFTHENHNHTKCAHRNSVSLVQIFSLSLSLPVRPPPPFRLSVRLYRSSFFTLHCAEVERGRGAYKMYRFSSTFVNNTIGEHDMD